MASVCLASVALVGCPPPPAAGPKLDLPAYQGRYAELFDDSIAPSAVGVEVDARPIARADGIVRERAQTSDGIVRVRVKTVTSGADGPEKAFVMDLHPVARLAGKKAPDSEFTVRFDKASPGYGIARSFEGRLVGKTFIAFVRKFSSASGEGVYHVHLAADSPDIEAAVKEWTVLDELH